MGFFLLIALLLAVLAELTMPKLPAISMAWQPSLNRIEAERFIARNRLDGQLVLVDSRSFGLFASRYIEHIETRLGDLQHSNVALLQRLALSMQKPVKRFSAVLEIFVTRVWCVVAALPMLVCGCALLAIDGWVRREVRKAGAGIESARIYHAAKRTLKPLVTWVVLVYLTVPFTMDPQWVYLVLYLTVPLTLGIAVSRFKKYV